MAVGALFPSTLATNDSWQIAAGGNVVRTKASSAPAPPIRPPTLLDMQANQVQK